ncbi:MAG TPA: enoyl-CoA hydratase/isomerase family protein [Myxococcaceae bacterium]|nr:enoyl-CoA hydratase/isomerase family protein [Myxococcaceae bacterium]
MTADGRLERSWLPGGIRVLTLERPHRRNALTPFLLDALAEALAPDPEVHALVLEARGPAFCAGYDLAQLGEDAAAARLPDARIQEVLGMLEAHPAPSVAVVDGAAFGAGCELACACDFRVGTPDTVLCMPPVRLGVVYAPEGVWRVARLAGLQHARWMFLTAAEVGAEEALRWGLLDAVAEDATARAHTLAATLASGAPLATAGLRRTLRAIGRAPIDPAERGELEALRAEAFASEDAHEARTALREKRPPRWRGR